MTRIAINGFGRIGRLIMRAALERNIKNLEIVALNDLADIEELAHLLKYDSVHGTLSDNVQAGEDTLRIGNMKSRVTSEADPEKLPWAEEKVDIVFECSGRFRSCELASKHLNAGAKRVLISAPGGPDVKKTIVYGVNHMDLSSDDLIVSNASCTTNCLAPLASVLDQKVGIKTGFATTIHSYTSSQNLLDSHHGDPRRSRSAALSIIPTTTGASRITSLVLPHLDGKLKSAAIRVPTPNVSLIDFHFNSKRKTSVEIINSTVDKASKSRILKGVLAYTEEELVSVDYNHHPASSIFDAKSTTVLDEKFVRVVSWYDNEWGFANRMLDTATAMAKLL